MAMVEEPLTLNDIIEWHYKQTRGRDIEEDVLVFHMSTATLLEGIRNTINKLSNTVNGEA